MGTSSAQNQVPILGAALPMDEPEPIGQWTNQPADEYEDEEINNRDSEDDEPEKDEQSYNELRRICQELEPVKDSEPECHHKIHGFLEILPVSCVHMVSLTSNMTL